LLHPIGELLICLVLITQILNQLFHDIINAIKLEEYG
jgi:hypothetical protein